MHTEQVIPREEERARAPKIGHALIAHNLGRLAVVLALVSIVGVGRGVAAAQAIPCTKQCRLLALACRIPFKVAFQTQRAACAGTGKRACITAARILYAAGKLLCRSVATTCRRSCKGNGTPGGQCG